MAYLIDNQTSKLILISSGADLIITFWKIITSTKFERRPDARFPYFQLKQNSSAKTQQHDNYATKILYKVFVVLLIGVTIYQLVYKEIKSYYSFTLNTLVLFIYMFGFVNMFPQLYINYKLKSVSHLPWRTLIYRFLNTIVDDIFAFIIVMPTLRRIAAFRDDVIFLIYMYQRWIYDVDETRTAYGHKQKSIKKSDEVKALECNETSK